MKKIFEQLIIDFHRCKIPEPSPREFTLPDLPKNVRKVNVFIGMRRSGKTWAMYQQMHLLLKQGCPQTKILYLNFEDDRLLGLKSEDLQGILEAYFELYPNFIASQDIHFFFDEIHEIPGWERFIRRLLDQEKMSLSLSGSSAKMLGKEIASALRGRTIIQEIFPFSFREYLHFHNIPFDRRLTTKEQAVFAHHAKDFLRYGGFPEAVSIDRRFHRELLQSYIDSVVYRDIVERHKVSNSHVVRELIQYGLQNPAALISVNKIYHRFKSEGQMVSKNSLYDFIRYLEDAYCLFTVPLYTFSKTQQMINPKKLYCVDQGLISAYTIKPEYEEASRLENAVFCQFRRRTEKIFYYKTRTGKEVDFLKILPNGERELYQVCVSLSKQSTLQRERDALVEALEELKLKKGIIVTLDQRESVQHKKKTIECLPAWQLFLEENIVGNLG